MGHTIAIEEAQRRLPDLIDQLAAHRDQPTTVVADDEAVMLLVDPHHYQLLRRLWERHLNSIRETQEYNADVDPEEIYREVTKAVEEVRQEQYERRHALAT